MQLAKRPHATGQPRCLVALIATLTACSGSSPSSQFDTGSSTGTGQGGTSSTGTLGSSTGAGGSIGTTGAGGSFLFEGGLPDGADYDAGDACGQSSVQASNKVVNILLVIDKSGSMTTTPTGFSTDKWTAMKTALSGALDQVKGGISFGLELFPNNLTTPIARDCTSDCWDIPPGDSAVLVAVGPGTTTVPQILAKLEIAPAGGTPTAAALKSAADYFTTGAGKSLTGDKYVLLATDGGPNGNGSISCDATTCTANIDRNTFATNYCDANIVPDGNKNCLDDKGSVDQISAMAAAGIKTFVIGIPGTEFPLYISTLDAMAAASGVPASTTSPKYYAVSASGGVAGLEQVFETITKQLITSCRQQLQSNPPDSMLLNVYVDGKLVTRGATDGWTLDTSTSPPTVVIQGMTCTNLQMNGASSIQILYGCPSIIVH
jgi:hypothetical protein